MDRQPHEEKSKALSELTHLLGLAKQLGNDDHESDVIRGLIRQVQEGEIDAGTAITRAREVIGSKNR